MGVERCDKIISLIDACLNGPNPEHSDGRNCWYCACARPHTGGPAGLCDVCLTRLRDPAFTVGSPVTGATDSERPAVLEGAYAHRSEPLWGQRP